jgi:hypothetical protein
MRRRRLDDRDDLPTSVPYATIRLKWSASPHPMRATRPVPQSDAARTLRPDYELVSMRFDLAAGCPGYPAPSIHEHCGVSTRTCLGDEGCSPSSGVTECGRKSRPHPTS